MEHLLTRAACLLLLSAAAACRPGGELERREKRALEESVSQAQDRVRTLDLKEAEGGELTPEEAEMRRRLKEQAEEDANGGEGRPTPPAPGAGGG